MILLVDLEQGKRGRRDPKTVLQKFGLEGKLLRMKINEESFVEHPRKVASSLLTEVWVDGEWQGQGVIFPAGVRVFPPGNLQNPQEILTKTLLIEQIL